MSIDHTTEGHASCATCPRRLRKGLAEQSDLWERGEDGWTCEYCAIISTPTQP